MSKIQNLRNKLEQKKGQRERIQSDIKETEDRIEQNGEELKRHEKAREIIRTVGLSTQQELQYNISEITSLALNSVLNDPYELSVEFVQRRNKTECDLWFKKNGEKINPYYGGGGPMDVASFALRVASWSMQTPRSRNVLVLDEPFRFLSRNLQGRASQMLSEISEKLGLQIIAVTHEERLIEEADKKFEVELKDGISHVKD